MKKKILSLILVVLVAVSLCSCNMLEKLGEAVSNLLPESLTDEYTYLEVVPDTLTYSKGYTPVTSSYSYDVLPLDGERQLYDEILKVCYDISAEFEEDAGYPTPMVDLDGVTLSEAEVRTAMKALSDDHPEVFWLNNNIGFYSDDEETLVRCYSRYSPDEVTMRVQAVNKVATEFYATVPDDLSEYSRELMIHDFLIDKIEYDESVGDYVIENEPNDYSTVYGALVDGKAVCEGYTRAFQMLSNGLGMDCVCVIGEGEDELHIWNDIKLGDSWYNVDVTWDDYDEIYLKYSYFNITDSALLEEHTYAPMYTELTDEEIVGDDENAEYTSTEMNLFIPQCDDTTMSYFYRSTPHLTDYDAADVKSALLYTAEQKEEYFAFYIDSELDYDSAIDDLFVEYPQYFFSYVEDVNWNLPDYSIDSSNINYYVLDSCRSIVVELSYY